MKRFDCLKVFASMMPADDLVVTSLGNTVFEWRTVRPSLANFYNVNLGQCTPVALGLALALPHRTVMELDGDGNLVSLIVFLLICPPSAQSKSKNPEVTISYRGVGIAHDLLKIIGANRIFEKHGVNATSIYIGSESLVANRS